MTSLALTTYSDIVDTPLDINSLIKEYQVKNIKGFRAYLFEMFKVLNKYSDDVIKGINYSTFKRVIKNFFNIFYLISITLIFLAFYPKDYFLCLIGLKVAI